MLLPTVPKQFVLIDELHDIALESVHFELIDSGYDGLPLQTSRLNKLAV